MKVNFQKEPDLWPEQFTDFFNFSTTASAEEVEECLMDALNVSEDPIYSQVSSHQFATSSQVLVEFLADNAYGHELIFQHTHIPKNFGETALEEHERMEDEFLTGASSVEQ